MIPQRSTTKNNILGSKEPVAYVKPLYAGVRSIRRDCDCLDTELEQEMSKMLVTV